MTIENEIKKLVSALEANTNSNLAVLNALTTHGLTISGTKAATVKKVELVATVAEDKPEDKPETDDNKATAAATQEAKLKANARIAEGVSRPEVKALITKLGADGIADLGAKELVQFCEQLETLKVK